MTSYGLKQIPDHDGMDLLKEYFPDGEADQLNFVLFSTSGISGHYGTIESVEKELQDGEEGQIDISYIIIKPRVKGFLYGQAICTVDDIPYLKKLRASSHKAVSKIGMIDSQGEK